MSSANDQVPLDLYEVLSVDVDADSEAIKKAFRRLSLLSHPDKVRATGQSPAKAAERFNAIKHARDVLEDADRRKVYDACGVDLGAERPEMEVWTLGLGTIMGPILAFTAKTLIARLLLVAIAFRWLSSLLLSLGVGLLGLFCMDFKTGSFRIRDPQYLPGILYFASFDALIVVHWISPLVADSLGIIWLVSEVTGREMLLDNKKILGCIFAGAFVFSWLVRGWWFWILALEATLCGVALWAVVIASGATRVWLDKIQAEQGDKVKTWRQHLRRERRNKQIEVNILDKQLESFQALTSTKT
eukprot:TRINITY_DN24666_c0_g3_i2.p1 TRINITY_DN24666_c0_g3~~TRINITY_DN24666_c0_g3_i2.p1  ORF type:complete len:301 (+),score=69.41 TRINITY_DN24666_c0_g3_i2:112-1014(+)